MQVSARVLTDEYLVRQKMGAAVGQGLGKLFESFFKFADVGAASLDEFDKLGHFVVKSRDELSELVVDVLEIGLHGVPQLVLDRLQFFLALKGRGQTLNERLMKNFNSAKPR